MKNAIVLLSLIFGLFASVAFADKGEIYLVSGENVHVTQFDFQKRKNVQVIIRDVLNGNMRMGRKCEIGKTEWFYDEMRINVSCKPIF